MKLTDEQEAAVTAALQVAATAGHMSLIGPAGCGKTTTIRAIAGRVLQRHLHKKVLLLAPTHKARRQFEAAELPPGVQTMTIQKFCKVRADQWRDQERFKITSSSDIGTIEEINRKFALVIVDEASMVSQELAAKTVDICHEAEVGVILAGDPYQLPPVKERLGDDDDGPDADVLDEGMAAEFLNAPVVISLNQVMRHGGPILEFATSMRADWDALHSFPGLSAADQESQIVVLQDTQSAYIEHFTQVYMQLVDGSIDETQFYRDCPRALCYTNRAVHALTGRLREYIYGRRAMDGWQKREIIMFPSYTRSADGRTIHSSTDAIVVDTSTFDVDVEGSPIHWKTPGRGLERVCELSFSGRFQELKVHVVKPNGVVDESQLHTVYTPLVGDDSPRASYTELRRNVLAVKPRLGSKHAAWQWLSKIKNNYLTPVTSAFVLTVHKSQGSTFNHVYVSRDLLATRDRNTRNPLLYVAVTRASKSITFGAVNVSA